MGEPKLEPVESRRDPEGRRRAREKGGLVPFREGKK